MNKTLIINRKECEELLTYDVTIEAMKEALLAVSEKKAKVLQRSMIGHESGNTLAIMPSSLISKNLTGSKVTIFGSQEARANGTADRKSVV